MRTAARLKLGYYPLPEADATRIRGFLTFGPEPTSVLDPCTGTGAAFVTITGEANVRRYGIELDAQRAREAQNALSDVVQGNALETHCPVESCCLGENKKPVAWVGGGRGPERRGD